MSVIENPAIMACRRVGESSFIDDYAARNGGTQLSCEDCFTMVWMSPAAQKQFLVVGHIVACCDQCAIVRLGDAPHVLGFVPGADEELKAMNRDMAERN